MADKLAWLFMILVLGGLIVGLIGVLWPLILFCVGVSMVYVLFHVVACVLGRIIG